MGDTVLLTAEGSFKQKVSSVLNGSSDYAGKHMFDGKLHTCWNSDQGEEQFVLIDFCKTVTLSTCSIMFQGGFVGQYCKLEAGGTVGSLVEIEQLHHIQDSNDLQQFEINSTSSFRYLKMTFKDFSDFYGRIIIYKLELHGRICE